MSGPMGEVVRRGGEEGRDELEVGGEGSVGGGVPVVGPGDFVVGGEDGEGGRGGVVGEATLAGAGAGAGGGGVFFLGGHGGFGGCGCDRGFFVLGGFCLGYYFGGGSWSRSWSRSGFVGCACVA